MKKIVSALALGAMMAVAAAGAANAKEWKTVRIASEGAYPPWNATDTSGKLTGFEVDLGNDLCKRMKVTCEFVAQDWDGIIPALQQGKYDAIMSAMTITDERKKVIDFSIPYGTEPSVFAVMANSPLAKSLALGADRVDLNDQGKAKPVLEKLADALKGKSVGVQVSTIQADFMDKHLPKVTMRTYDKIDNAGIDLSSGRVDAMLGDRSVVEAVVKATPDKMVIVGPNFIGGVIGEGMGVGLRKDTADLKAMFDKAIAEALKDGTVKKLSTQHFGYDISPTK
ncbi:transporter substrate-binding domain-containing protein [Azospirillum oryzae]|uniref:Transporter substrate-binding domain-containing protein n=1 Tax=Azospirillum oryzae TaxID=286727 RepID=A0A6N1AHF3_9PROT|nr:transporter substrate-binding domain-containing protein [Azospirillum sp. Sh1]KAA0586140.1 transporter substrate-binding domain-containing protein [Azospirillum oryzae]QKS51016.1 transporter substrate-binding domain-containing protein [Azospirillum oryzae]GLR81766.1 nopaline-binding periplasmic protein [Azospirillum oryzae]